MNQAIKFSGELWADRWEKQLTDQVAELGVTPVLAAVYFHEDAGSRLYTRLKSEAAARVGIKYLTASFSLADPVENAISKIREWVNDSGVTGVMVQKPWAKMWIAAQSNQFLSDAEAKMAYAAWWDKLMMAIPLAKDVDGLSVETRNALKTGAAVKVVPATCRAVLFILTQALEKHLAWLPSSSSFDPVAPVKVALIGKSDLLTVPLFNRLRNYPDWWTDQAAESQFKTNQIEWQPELFTSVSLANYLAVHQQLFDFQVIVSATGVPNLIQPEWIKPGSILIDAGEPLGDIDPQAYESSVFYTPVPGGVGPLTVSFLLKNCLDLIV